MYNDQAETTISRAGNVMVRKETHHIPPAFVCEDLGGGDLSHTTRLPHTVTSKLSPFSTQVLCSRIIWPCQIKRGVTSKYNSTVTGQENSFLYGLVRTFLVNADAKCCSNILYILYISLSS